VVRLLAFKAGGRAFETCGGLPRVVDDTRSAGFVPLPFDGGVCPCLTHSQCDYLFTSVLPCQGLKNPPPPLFVNGSELGIFCQFYVTIVIFYINVSFKISFLLDELFIGI
jgi:hypothetical protein